jgi:hypothetical protein
MNALTVLGAVIALVFASARLTRVIVFDDYPPSRWVRNKWDQYTATSGWNELFHCPYCMGVWVALPLVVLAAGLTLGWGIFGTLVGLFWLVCAWLAVAYLSGIIVATNWG